MYIVRVWNPFETHFSPHTWRPLLSLVTIGLVSVGWCYEQTLCNETLWDHEYYPPLMGCHT